MISHGEEFGPDSSFGEFPEAFNQKPNDFVPKEKEQDVRL